MISSPCSETKWPAGQRQPEDQPENDVNANGSQDADQQRLDRFGAQSPCQIRGGHGCRDQEADLRQGQRIGDHDETGK